MPQPMTRANQLLHHLVMQHLVLKRPNGKDELMIVRTRAPLSWVIRTIPARYYRRATTTAEWEEITFDELVVEAGATL